MDAKNKQIRKIYKTKQKKKLSRVVKPTSQKSKSKGRENLIHINAE